jgi:hypothetical protein
VALQLRSGVSAEITTPQVSVSPNLTVEHIPVFPVQIRATGPPAKLRALPARLASLHAVAAFGAVSLCAARAPVSVVQFRVLIHGSATPATRRYPLCREPHRPPSFSEWRGTFSSPSDP